MIYTGSSIPWDSFWLFVGQLMLCVVGPIVLVFLAVKLGAFIYVHIRTLEFKDAARIQMFVFFVLAFMPPIVVYFAVPPNATKFATVSALIISLVFAVTVISTIREKCRNGVSVSKDW